MNQNNYNCSNLIDTAMKILKGHYIILLFLNHIFNKMDHLMYKQFINYYFINHTFIHYDKLYHLKIYINHNIKFLIHMNMFKLNIKHKHLYHYN